MATFTLFFGVLFWRDDFGDAVEDFQRIALRDPQARSTSDAVDVPFQGFGFFLPGRRADLRAGGGAGSSRTSRWISSRSSCSVGRYSL